MGLIKMLSLQQWQQQHSWFEMKAGQKLQRGKFQPEAGCKVRVLHSSLTTDQSECVSFQRVMQETKQVTGCVGQT